MAPRAHSYSTAEVLDNANLRREFGVALTEGRVMTESFGVEKEADEFFNYCYKKRKKSLARL